MIPIALIVRVSGGLTSITVDTSMYTVDTSLITADHG